MNPVINRAPKHWVKRGSKPLDPQEEQHPVWRQDQEWLAFLEWRYGEQEREDGRPRRAA